MHWTTRDGRKIKIEDMPTDHLKNCLNYLEKIGEDISYIDQCGRDGDSMYYDLEPNPIYIVLQRELGRRKTK